MRIARAIATRRAGINTRRPVTRFSCQSFTIGGCASTESRSFYTGILLFLRRRRHVLLSSHVAHSRESVCALLKRRCSLFRGVAPVSQHALSIKFRCVSTNYATRVPASRLILAASPIVLMPLGPRSMGIGRPSLSPPQHLTFLIKS